jgi:outer membrane protein OmpA-like peptidoglycan-associated protein
MSILVNGKAVQVPTIQAKGVFSVAGDNLNVELWILDNPANPMMLRMRGDSGQRQTIRIDYPQKQPQQSALQQALSSGDCRVALNGIYFDFGKSTLLPQSTSALQAVVDLMQKNPDWKLRIEGHTDNIGGDTYNLDLSKKRAAAVNTALTTNYKLAPARFSAEGFGASKPVAKNDTIEGRAANRRVELARTCP